MKPNTFRRVVGRASTKLVPHGVDGLPREIAGVEGDGREGGITRPAGAGQGDAAGVGRCQAHLVGEGDGLEHGLQFVIAVGTQVTDTEVQVDLGGSPDDDGRGDDGQHVIPH